MTVPELLRELADSGIRLASENGDLVIQADKGSLTPKLRDQLIANKQQLLTLLQTRWEHPIGTVPPDLEHRYEPFPITDIQQAYWVGRRADFDLGRVGCHYYQEFESDELDLGRLEETWNLLLQRHEMLRTVFLPDGRQQILSESPQYRIDVLDLHGKDPGTVTEELARVRERMSHHVFVPDQWPLFEIFAVRISEHRIRLYISLDLLIIDAVSLSMILEDWRRLYEDRDSLKPLDFSFRDYVLAARARRETDSYQRSKDYWRRRMTTIPAAPSLPLRHPIPEDSCRNFVRRKSFLSREHWNRLKEWAGHRGLTPSGLLAAAFAEVLGNWSLESAFTLNITLCQRIPFHPQVKQIVGDFTSTLLLPIDRSPITFEQRARHIQDELNSGMDHSEMSGVEVLRELSRRSEGPVTMPVVFTSLLGHPDRTDTAFTSNWLGNLVYGVSQTPQVRFDYQVFEHEGGLIYHWDTIEQDYAPGILDAMFAAHSSLLVRLAKEDQTWSAPDLCLTPCEQLQKRERVNATSEPVSDALLYTLFERQAAMNPHRPAVISADGTLTYEELEQHSRWLAHQLREAGARPDRLIGIVMEKGWEQIVSALAILRAGSAYLPIDADWPTKRIDYLVEHGQLEILLTQPHLKQRFSWPDSLRVLTVDATEPVEPIPPLEPIGSSANMAYTIFTSGSTGQPKGVVIDHRSVVNTILDINRRFGINADDRVLALSSLSFDLSVYDIFGLLAAGGAVVLPQASARRDPAAWIQQIRDERITLWNSVPALMKMLVDYADGQPPAILDNLRIVLMSGDWIPISLPDQIRQLAPKASLVSLGGATEASIWSIYYPIESVDPDWPSIPYGKPLVNQTFHVLDERLEPCPELVAGRIYIGGIGLAREYWRNESETEARFLQHSKTGERLYHTGDLGRYLPDGNIEILGREDFQVKIRGHRIELGEIAHRLSSHPEVANAVVTAREDTPHQLRLIAYVVPHTPIGNGSLEEWTGNLKEHLQEELPSYMVPAVFVTLDTLPLSANGKVDRGKLPAPKISPVNGSFPTCSPRTEVEQAVTQIVAEVLDLESVPVQENLFDLGCTSLQVILIHRKLHETLDTDIPVVEMFDYPNIRSLAIRLSDRNGSIPKAIDAAPTRKRIRLSRAARGRRLQGRKGHSDG